MDLHLFVRWLHVGAGMSLVGGAFVLALAIPARGSASEAIWAVARRYEWLCWASLAVIVASGVGNLGAFGAGLPPPESDWGLTFLVKMGLVLVLASLSVVRTAAVVRLAAALQPAPPALRALYVATTVLGLAVAAAAQVMAHG
jgi:uncharacterized membrane protein